MRADVTFTAMFEVETEVPENLVEYVKDVYDGGAERIPALDGDLEVICLKAISNMKEVPLLFGYHIKEMLVYDKDGCEYTVIED